MNECWGTETELKPQGKFYTLQFWMTSIYADERPSSTLNFSPFLKFRLARLGISLMQKYSQDLFVRVLTELSGLPTTDHLLRTPTFEVEVAQRCHSHGSWIISSLCSLPLQVGL